MDAKVSNFIARLIISRIKTQIFDMCFIVTKWFFNPFFGIEIISVIKGQLYTNFLCFFYMFDQQLIGLD